MRPISTAEEGQNAGVALKEVSSAITRLQIGPNVFQNGNTMRCKKSSEPTNNFTTS
jgi:hypothetical protein